MIDAICTGESSDANFIHDRIANCARLLQTSSALGIEQLIRGELADVWEECSVPNWDGYGALAVTSKVYSLARKFLESLPLGTALPSVGAEPDGQITLQWGRSPRRILSVSVSPDEELHFAALLGSSRICGTEPFFSDEVPLLIRQLIDRVT